MPTEEIEYLLTVNVDGAVSNVQRFERVLFRSFTILRHMNPDNPALDAVAGKMQRLITIAHSLQMSMNLLDIAMASTGNPLALAGAAVGLVTTGFMVGEMLQDNG